MTRKTEITPMCCDCGVKPAIRNGQQKTKLGFQKFFSYCRSCRRKRWPVSKGKVDQYRKAKLPICTKCGFVPQDRCQLDVDHIDGDHQNNDPANHQTLCANCHRLKTHRPDLFSQG
jgi:hypothetical protein